MAQQRAQDVLAENVVALMTERWGRPSSGKLAKESGLGVGTVHRIRSAESAAGVDSVESIAGVFGAQPWQLLVPGLDPHHMPGLSVMSPMARQLACALDAIEDVDLHHRAYAVLMQELVRLTTERATQESTRAPGQSPVARDASTPAAVSS